MMLPKEIKIGAAAAATQIEGGALEHTWMDWYRRGKIPDSPERATDHWRRWREDAELMAALGLQVYRMGLEWARIEPEPGVFDAAVIDRYREELAFLRERGIQPLVTLHHFTNPLWFERRGGFENIENLPLFLEYVRTVVAALGPLAEEYLTVNEPNVFALFGYFYGIWPPGARSFRRTFRVMSVLAAAHIRAYALIHRVREEAQLIGTKVSFANHIRPFVPLNPKNPAHRLCAGLNHRLFQGSLSRALYRGEFSWPLENLAGLPRGRYADFIGLNYYTRSTVRGFADGTMPGAPVNDLGWEIYPPGIVEAAAFCHGLCPGPIYVTENGTCDNEDRFRARYIYEHLQALAASPLPVERYYHWCFCDNFEWAEGESARFGIVHVDFETQKRTVKESGRFLAALIQAGGVDQALYDRFLTTGGTTVNRLRKD